MGAMRVQAVRHECRFSPFFDRDRHTMEGMFSRFKEFRLIATGFDRLLLEMAPGPIWIETSSISVLVDARQGSHLSLGRDRVSRVCKRK